MIEPIWISHKSFKALLPNCTFPYKKYGDKHLYHVNAIHDTAATMNLIAQEIILAAQASMIPENKKGKIWKDCS